jgi:hypothetical protein
VKGRIALLVFFPGLVAVGRGLAAEAPSRTPLAVARQEAESNAKTPAGRRYEEKLIPGVEDWLRQPLERCVKNVPKEELVSFDAFVRIGAAGEAEEILFGPETAVARCVAPDFREAKYPSPPEPAWWVKIEVHLTR